MKIDQAVEPKDTEDVSLGNDFLKPSTDTTDKSLKFRFIILSLLALNPIILIYGQETANTDTLYYELSRDIVVTAFDGRSSLMDTPGSISRIKEPVLRSFNPASLVQTFNSVPGVRFEERATGSYRIAIRGSALRSPFGVRNVKVYWNGIPFTQPTGSTPFNLFDAINFERVEVIKGPTGSVYGAGTGGTILIESLQRKPSTGLSLNTNGMLGAYGMQRFSAKGVYTDPDGRYSLQAGYADQASDGYRDQNFMNREVIESRFMYNLEGDHQWSLFQLYSDLDYGIPGGLTSAQFRTDPTQARPGNPFALGSEAANASIDQRFILIGAGHDFDSGEGFSIRSRVFMKQSDFDNPFNLDYKIEDRRTLGVRSVGSYRFTLDQAVTLLTGGIEYQFADNRARNFENDSSRVGNLNFEDDLDLNSLIIFLKNEWILENGWTLNFGLSYNDFRYQINRIEDNLSGNPGLVIRDFDPVLVPRAGLAYRYHPNHAVHATLSYGFSAPTLEEVRTNEGSINLNLQPEKGINYELGFRGNSNNQRLSYDVALFYFNLRDAIVQRESPRGTTLFSNSGSTNQLGFEISTGYLLHSDPQTFISRAEVQLAYTRHAFEFDAYVRNGEDFSGNDLTGVAPNILIGMLNIESSNAYLRVSHNFTDRIPLNDSNTVYADAYHQLQARIGLRKVVFQDYQMEIFFGSDNILNQEYSLGNDINAFGDRFFQPAPERNFYAGLSFTF